MELCHRGGMLLLAQGQPEQRRLLGIILDRGHLQIIPAPAAEVMSGGDLPVLAPLFQEPEGALRPLVLEIPRRSPAMAPILASV